MVGKRMQRVSIDQSARPKQTASLTPIMIVRYGVIRVAISYLARGATYWRISILYNRNIQRIATEKSKMRKKERESLHQADPQMFRFQSQGIGTESWKLSSTRGSMRRERI